jgi:hypothetical protein
MLAAGLLANLHPVPGAVAPPSGPVAWPYLVLPLVGLALVLLAVATFWLMLRLPAHRLRRRAPTWATGIPDISAAITAVEEAEACIHAHEPLMSRALARLACSRSLAQAGVPRHGSWAA